MIEIKGKVTFDCVDDKQLAINFHSDILDLCFKHHINYSLSLNPIGDARRIQKEDKDNGIKR